MTPPHPRKQVRVCATCIFGRFRDADTVECRHPAAAFPPLGHPAVGPGSGCEHHLCVSRRGAADIHPLPRALAPLCCSRCGGALSP